MKASKNNELEVAAYPYLGTVVEQNNGVVAVININGELLTVTRQASHIPPLAQGDEVLFFYTQQGPYVIAKSLAPNDAPAVAFQQIDSNTLAMQFGEVSLSIMADGALQLLTPKAQLLLDKKGHFLLDGVELEQRAKGDININSARHVHLNSC